MNANIVDMKIEKFISEINQKDQEYDTQVHDSKKQVLESKQKAKDDEKKITVFVEENLQNLKKRLEKIYEKLE